LLEAKHQQQLRDLEEAMKSTWEDKARISEEHEKERLRLEREQQEAQKRLVQQREEHWKLLESRSDIDMTISHLKDLLRSVRADGGSDLVGSWPAESREILRLEAALSEQFTAIDVYRASVTKDGDNLLAASEKVGIAP
jgi:chromosome segregation ATPase